MGALLDASIDHFAVEEACAGAAALIGMIASYRVLAEALALARWLGEPSTTSERDSRARGLANGQLRRLERIAGLTKSEPVFEASNPLLTPNEGLLKRRLSEAAGAPAENVPSREALFRAQLPGGYTTFAAVSELASHVGTLNAILRPHVPEDFVFWLSVTYATLVSVVGEVARAAARGDLVSQLESLIDDADDAVAVAWPEHWKPSGPHSAKGRSSSS
jgi:hypothetical protein